MSEFELSRTATVNAPIQAVHDAIADLHKWEQWSPWQDLDPNMEQFYSGPEAGIGASVYWVGNSAAGEGKMTIVTNEPSIVEVDIEFLKPFKATNRSHFYLAPKDEGSTTVIWQMTGHLNRILKFIYRLAKMEEKIGADFEKGLARLGEYVTG